MSVSPGEPLPLQYIAVGLIAGAIIALQITVMRVFAVGSWVHFGSLVIALAMLGFGLSSVVISLARTWLERHWRQSVAATLALFGPLMVAAELLAQQMPFNAIFLTSDPAQKWRLGANFVLYLLPFLTGALFLGIVFLAARKAFGRVYFADLAGSGISGLLMLAGMYVFAPENLLVVPLLLWAAGSAFWFASIRSRRGLAALLAIAGASIAAYVFLPGALGIPKLAVCEYKGVAYARHFPDAGLVYRNYSPFGDLEVYASSYLHFAPGLSDNAAFTLPEVPSNAYLGMYIDGDGPIGIMRDLPPADTAYFRFLPMFYPYVLKRNPETFVVELGGGISTFGALRSGARRVTVAESNPAILRAFASPEIRNFTGDLLNMRDVRVIPYDGRLYLAHTSDRYDIVDLSLADSVGLSNPGGFAIVEKYLYTRAAMGAYMRALKPGGILAATLWNKEEPPKSVLRFYATIAAAAHDTDPGSLADSFFVASSYLSTATVLYKRGGFSAAEIATLRDYTRAMSFDEIYSPGFVVDTAETDRILRDYRDSIFAPVATTAPTDAGDGGAAAQPADDGASAVAGNSSASDAAPVPATVLGRLAWHYLTSGGWDDMAARYVFAIAPLTNDRPYFAAYERWHDLIGTLNRLDLFQDDWGFLVLWATLAIACVAAISIVLVPLAAGWRFGFSGYPGKLGTVLYFSCLGLGYIMVEVGFISRFILALGNATVSASILITGMLVFSGLGSFVSERVLERAAIVLPAILVAIATLLLGYAVLVDPLLNWIGRCPYPLRLVLSLAVIAPPAFLMGFPMAMAMTMLARCGKDQVFVWAWGVNGCFSVIGAALAPIIATTLGLAAVLEISGVAYVLAISAAPVPRSAGASRLLFRRRAT